MAEGLADESFILLAYHAVIREDKLSPYPLAATLKFHFEKYRDLFPETCEILSKSFWVDDFVVGTEQADTRLKIIAKSMEILKNAGMVLRKWQTNSVKLREALKLKKTKPFMQDVVLLRRFWDPD
ncbi:uncharacterized protein NPIL_369051 [Nephila pilipes]|uniref:Uncharacterized protein n=1 Tax=Nephila pilipes TaxID=299642 RepID=A0A8X6TB40_NEPPI|nr:uncharacterized protein NPIL_369051 [Nephila pilipes]